MCCIQQVRLRDESMTNKSSMKDEEQLHLVQWSHFNNYFNKEMD